MPIGYYPAWERTQSDLARRYSEWIPAQGLPSNRYVRPEQKRREMELADLVLAPSSFVEGTIRSFDPAKRVERAAYGVDLDFWQPDQGKSWDHPVRFLYAGQISLRKGIPLLLEAWEAADLRESRLDLVGVWQLSASKRAVLPPGVTVWPPCSREALRERYRTADVFLFPSYFEGFGLVLLEAMSSGLPALASEATAGPDVLTESCGRLIPCGSLEALVEGLKWFVVHQGRLPSMALAARQQAARFTWASYRKQVSEAVGAFV
ncbi:MAG: glycosyltransferase family 4 protein [Thermoanaerobaculia bacterium]